MESRYHSNYFKSIAQGLTDTIYYLDQQKKDPESFFKTLKSFLLKIKENKSKIYFLGNGASSAFANHMALDFSKNGKILSRSLSDSAMLTALSNDYTFETAMEEYLKIEGITIDDLVITISSSGNSPNIISALNYCKTNNITTLSLSGLNNLNKSIEIAKYSIFVPMKTYGMVECIHQIFLHLILDNLMDVFEWDRIESQNMSISSFKI